jgi:hypothetical protein
MHPMPSSEFKINVNQATHIKVENRTRQQKERNKPHLDIGGEPFRK